MRRAASTAQLASWAQGQRTPGAEAALLALDRAISRAERVGTVFAATCRMGNGTTRGIWLRHDLGLAKADYLSLVRCATLAASSHNTQPWKFRLEPNRIVILPDPARRCPEIDPDDHHLFASLGCAAENLVLAGEAAGLHADVAFDESESSVRVDFEPQTPCRSALFDAIPERQTSRVVFDGSVLSQHDLQALELAGRGAGVSPLLLVDRERKEAVAEYVAAGNTAQFRDPRWAREMRKWIRFNAREAHRSGDGLYGPVLGIPNVPRWLGEVMMPLAASSTRQNRKDLEGIRSAGAVVVLVSEVDDARHWVEAGRCCQRLTLEATARGLRSAFINQPVEVAALRAQLATYLHIGEGRPDLVLRIGRGPERPRSLRRPIEEVVLPDGRPTAKLANRAPAPSPSLSAPPV